MTFWRLVSPRARLALLALAATAAALLTLSYLPAHNTSALALSVARHALPSAGDPSRLYVATRLHLGQTSSGSEGAPALPPADALRSFIRGAAAYGAVVALAASADEARHGAALVAHVRSVTGEAEFAELVARGSLVVLPIAPWGAFVSAPNALALAAAAAGCGRILFQSLEVSVSPAALAVLLGEMSAGTLVAGAALAGHAFAPLAARGGPAVVLPLDGTTTPWNTLAVWDTALLTAIGFPLIGEGAHAGIGGGVEEVTAIALAQLVMGGCAAKLVRLPPSAGAVWEAVWEDTARTEWHERKMRSKRERPAAQLAALGRSGAGVVEHLDRSG